jgi:hypothetical protein
MQVPHDCFSSQSHLHTRLDNPDQLPQEELVVFTQVLLKSREPPKAACNLLQNNLGSLGSLHSTKKNLQRPDNPLENLFEVSHSLSKSAIDSFHIKNKDNCVENN